MIDVILNNETLMIFRSGHTQEREKWEKYPIINLKHNSGSWGNDGQIDGQMSLWMEDKHWKEGTEAVLISWDGSTEKFWLLEHKLYRTCKHNIETTNIKSPFHSFGSSNCTSTNPSSENSLSYVDKDFTEG